MRKAANIQVGSHYNSELDKIIEKKDAELKELARNNATHQAKNNLPDPNARGILSVITEDIKAGYEELISLAYQHQQPAAHLPEAQMDGALAGEQNQKLDSEINKLHDLIRNKERELGKRKTVNLKQRIRNALLFTAIICLGEIVFNTMAFQTMGDNMLFCFLLSTSVTLAIFSLAHFAANQFKNTESRKKKIMVVAGSLLAASAVFIVLANLRSAYMAQNDILTNPVIFFVLNLILFIATALVSYQLMPSKKEIAENREIDKIHETIEKLKKEILVLELEKDDINRALTERNIERSRLAHYVEYTVARIIKKYQEALAIYKSENINTRTDGKIPVCFTEEIPPIKVNNSVINYQFIKEE
jgi:hypothetical protein